MLERRQRRARRKHPAAEEAVRDLLARAHFINLDKRRALRRFLRRVLLAVADANRQSAETQRRADLRLEFRDARGDLVEPLEDRHRLGDRLAER